MWPWGHLTVGYLLYTVFTRLRYRRLPEDQATVALLIGTQLPDVIDKPLAWTFEILPHGRSLGHSLFTTIALVTVVGLLFRHYSSDISGAFGIGYLSHLLGDAAAALIEGGYSALRFLAWPVVPAVEYRTTPSLVGHIRDIEITLWFLMQVGIAAFVLVIWIYDRKPGLATAKRIPRLVWDSRWLSW